MLTVWRSDSNTAFRQAAQEAITTLNSRIPKINTEDGDEMDPEVLNTYHQLDSYGDVFLYWKVNLENSPTEAAEVDGSFDQYDANDEDKREIVKCWVEAAPNIIGGDIGEITSGSATTNRRLNEVPHNGTGTPQGGPTDGLFRVKLGTVNEDETVKQYISSDVTWSITVLDRVIES